MKKALVIYYSYSGNTAKVAKDISDYLKCDIEQIEAIDEYPQVYQDLVKQVMKEIKEGIKPAIKNTKYNVEEYEVIFVGTPNWCGTLASPLVTYLTNNSFDEKIVIPFCSNGGGGCGNVENDVAKYCPKAKVFPCIDIQEDNSKNISDILDKLQLK